MKMLRLTLIFLLLLVAPALAQNKGDKINLNGVGPRLLNATALKSMKFSKLELTNPPVTTLDKLTQWTSGGLGGWAPYKAGSTAMFNSLASNWEIEAYPNQTMIDDLGITGLYSLDADGALVIQPRLLKPNEQAAINQSIANLDAGNAVNAPRLRNIRWLSGWVDTQPAGITPPFVIGARVQMPYPCKQGYWPAVWLLKAGGGWPPETDILENVCRNDLGFQLTSNMHSNDAATGSQPSITVPGTFSVGWNANAAGYHDYWGVVYNDKTHIFYDGVKVGEFITPPDWRDQPAYMIINYALAGANNGWPGPLDPSITSVPPMKILDVYAAKMPATYGSGPVMAYNPPNGSALITVGATVPVPPATCSPVSPANTLVNTVGPKLCMKGGDTFAMTSGAQIAVNGNVIPESAGVVELWTDGTALWQHAKGTGWDLWWAKKDGLASTPWTQPGQAASPIPVTPPIPPPGVTAAQIAAIVAAQTTAQNALNKTAADEALLKADITAAQAAAAAVQSLLGALKP